MISVIVPTLNEAEALKTFPPLQGCELIFVDGGSVDGTLGIASKLGRVVRSKRGRGTQMNRGAREASGGALLFLHADARLEHGALEAAERAAAEGYVGGGFTPRIEADSFLYRWIERAGAFRARRLGLFYGDAGIFATREAFESVGGFPEIPICEEFEFCRALRRLGRVTLLAPACRISPRRWERLGIVRATLRNWLITALFFAGVPPEQLSKIYRHVR